MTTTPPPFTLMHVRLVGHRDLGPVRARYVGCWLEVDHPEHGGRYGPAAVFQAVEVVEKRRLVWLKEGPSVWALCHPDRQWMRAAGYSCGTLSACSYVNFGEDVKRDAQINGSREGVRQIATWAREDGYEVPPHPEGLDCEPEPAPVEPPKPARVMGQWKRDDPGVWYLYSADGVFLAIVNSGGTSAACDRGTTRSRLTGIAGRRWAMNELLNDSWQLGGVPMVELPTVRDIKSGQVHHLVEGGERTVHGTAGSLVLYDDHTWIHITDLATKVEHIADAEIPF